ncbi:MAG: hypothetical protein ABIB79_01820 [archaeon]
MVELIGVCHGGSINLAGIIPLRSFSVYPSQGLINYLSGFPNDITKIGLETLSSSDWKDIEVDLKNLAYKRLNLLFNENGRNYLPSYDKIHEKYWRSLEFDCRNLGFEVEFLEDKETWFMLNRRFLKEALIKSAINEKILFRKEGESDIDYPIKLAKCNEVKHKAELFMRELHEIGRDKKLLENIARSGVDLAIVGQGHADFWFGDEEGVKEKYGIEITKYSTDLPQEVGFDKGEMKFTENANLDPSLLFNRESLEVSLRIIKEGRVVNSRIPDYVGVWDYVEPSEGYFEMFFDPLFKGTDGAIYDSLGVAIFNGKIERDKVEFIKKYGSLSLPTASKKPIMFRAIRDGEGYYGRYCIPGVYDHIFYMEKPNGKKPIDLTTKLYAKWKENRKMFDQFKCEELAYQE